MTRHSDNEYDRAGNLLNGFDYEHQAWVRDGRYVRCGHIAACDCYGRLKAGIRVLDAA